MIGLDVGSTTVKAVVVDPRADTILWKNYERHGARQLEKASELLEAIEVSFPNVSHSAYRLFCTGSGGAVLADQLGGKLVHEINAVSLATEKLHPEAYSVIELGGQDSKIIIFSDGNGTGKKKIPTMNDKCAGGTGAVIDKITAKLHITAARLCEMAYDGVTLHPIAGKCGVFAETDINSLQKLGAPTDELIASLFESIVQQNLSVLTRGHTLQPTVLLLGGPNYYVKGMQECWKHNIANLWRERGIQLPDTSRSADDYIVTPDDAHYFAAIGAVEFGRLAIRDDPHVGLVRGRAPFRETIDFGRSARNQIGGTGGLIADRRRLADFKDRYQRAPWTPPTCTPGTIVEAFIGLDGGSTSTKAVLTDRENRVIAKAYQLSKGNPIEDAIEILAALRRAVTDQGCTLKVLGVGTTGYAKDILKSVFRADLALVETVAHTRGGLHFYPDSHVIVDVGGQDIKLIFLSDGRVKDFRLNTQCSAGNGYFLQSTASRFGYDVRDYADIAFTARSMPGFGYGCAVFLQTDIVDFQRQGWQPHEIMAGLASVLPKNIWLYVAKIPNLPKLGTKFILQGGTQHNLAAVKAQVDFIESRFRGSGLTPEIVVHEHCAESAAIGCAIEANRLFVEEGRQTEFIGVDAVGSIEYRTTRDESTRCHYCRNKCLRTFIDVTSTPRPAKPHGSAPGAELRLIVATCEKGTVNDIDEMRKIRKNCDAIKKANPNLVEVAAREAFGEPTVDDISNTARRTFAQRFKQTKRIRNRGERMERRAALRIGLPRVLNMYSHAPFFNGFFMSLGVPFQNVVWSDETSAELYKAGSTRGSIDPCFPSKLGIPHIHNLLTVHHDRTPLTHIFFPMVDSFPTFLHGVQSSRACPTVVATPEATHAAFVKEGDAFTQRSIVFKKTFLNLDEPRRCARQMHEGWKDELGLSPEESYRATLQGLKAMEAFDWKMRARGRAIIDRLEAEQRLGIVVLGRPYHNDIGINHGICEELQKRGYPILWQDSLPTDPDMLERLFGDDVASGTSASPLGIEDVWKNSYSENSSRKLWATKYIARHPNLVALELSSFKCGHDAPIYTVIEEILQCAQTPYFCFKDIDENKPKGSLDIRIETIAYFLEHYRRRLMAEQDKREEIEQRVSRFKRQLLTAGDHGSVAQSQTVAPPSAHERVVTTIR